MQMNRDTLRQITTIFITILTLVVNSLATTLPLNNKTTAELSDSFHIRFVPAGYVFAVWGVIYIGFVAYTIWQALPRNRENPRARAIGWWYIGGSIANTLWLVFWHYQYVAVTLPIMLTLLATLIITALRLHAMPAQTWGERLCLDFPMRIYLGWISVATVVNVTVVLFDNGLKVADELAILWAIVLIAVAAGLALFQRGTRGDTAYGMVIAWALYGVAVKQDIYVTQNILPAAPLLHTVAAVTAQALAGVLAVWWVVGLITNRRAAKLTQAR
jgi:hypothetical protein